MTETERKFYQNSSKSWLSVVRSMETRGKKQLLPSNGSLYHYAGNNPVKYTDPDGRWTLTVGIGNGITGKIKIGHNEEKWEVLWRIGFGMGEALKFDFSDSAFVDTPKIGIYAEANGSIEANGLSAGGELEVGVEGDCESGEVSLQSGLSIGATGLNGETIGFEISNGEISPAEPNQNLEFGEEAFLFAGFGGEGHFKDEK